MIREIEIEDMGDENELVYQAGTGVKIQERPSENDISISDDQNDTR